VERAEHDAWFRAEVEQSLKEADPNAAMIPHEAVLRKWKARRAELIKSVLWNRPRRNNQTCYRR
jgi:hypothetical protein